jgi:DNA-binding SARP family transcriptional activator/DNA polymerase III delta prime subunit
LRARKAEPGGTGLEQMARQEPAPGAVVIRVLGPFAFEWGRSQADESVWRRTHARYLLQLLCSKASLSESRAKVLEILWPDFDDARARNRLHHTVHWIRKGFEGLPTAVRPQLTVGVERVELRLPIGVLCDTEEFRREIENDLSDDADRLASIDRALAWYRGPLAPDWSELSTIESRRSWFAKLYQQALTEGIELARELGQLEAALRYAQRRAQHLETDIDAHCVFAQLLAEQGRGDRALTYCQEVRSALATSDALSADALAPLESLAREIQQRLNRSPEVTTIQPATVVLAPQPARSIGRLPAERPLIGYESLAQAALQALRGPYSSLVSLVGPPGAGKTALALHVAHRLAGEFRHGALWINWSDCTGVVPPSEALLAQLASQLGAGSADAKAVVQVLCDKEMLIVVDGLEATPGLAQLFADLSAHNPEVRWVVTSWSALQVRSERTLVVDPSLLLATGDEHGPSYAARLIASVGSHGWSLSDKRVRRSVEALSQAVDGLPALLEVAAWSLQSMWPNELLARLDREPGLLVRLASERQASLGPHAAAATHIERQLRWLKLVPARLRELLAIASSSRSWLSRSDLAELLDDGSGDHVDGWIDEGMRQHLLLRRIREGHAHTWSEFRVPRFISALVAGTDGSPSTALVEARLMAWLMRTHAATDSAPPLNGALAVDWFDDRFEDFDALITRWQAATGRHNDIARLCLAHVDSWTGSRYATQVLGWLMAVGEHASALDDAIAAPFLMGRAQLRVHLGQLHGAFEDAGRALIRAKSPGDEGIRNTALRLMERYGSSDAKRRWPDGVDERGIEAGEGLLRVAQLAARQGDLAKAMQLSAEAVGVFTYFGLTRGLLKAHQCRARLAFALGDTALAMQCVMQADRTARVLSDVQEIHRAELMRSHVLIADQQFGKAIDLANSVLASTDMPVQSALLVHGLLALAWAHFAVGAYPVTRALCNEIREHAQSGLHAGPMAQADMLSSLVDARQGRSAAAVRKICKVLDGQSRERPLIDAQADLINVADLVFHLGRPDLALPVVQALHALATRPDHRLRPWVAERLAALEQQIPQGVQPAVPNGRLDTRLPAADVLVNLLLG